MDSLAAAESSMPGRDNPTAGARVFHAVFEALRTRLLSGEWLPGQRLPSIVHLGNQLGAGSGSVREALRSLQSLGYVSIEHGRGVFVKPPTTTPDAHAAFQDVDAGTVLALCEARRVLEPEMAAMAAERGSDEQRSEIMRLAAEMEALAAAGDDFDEPDNRFHHCIAEASGNLVLVRMLDGVNELFRESRRLTSVTPGMTPRAVRYHLLIGEAILERNPAQARLLMLAHVNDATQALVSARAAAGRTSAIMAA